MTTQTPPASGLLVVAVDRLPAWIVPAYGATWVAMPALDALAARGMVFDRVITTTDDAGATLRDLLGADGAEVVRAAAARGWPAALVTDDATATVAGADTIRVAAGPKAAPEHDADATCLARLFTAAHDVVAAGGHRLVIVHATSLGTCWDAPAEFRDAYVDADDPPPPPGAEVPDFDVAADADPDLLVGIRQAYAGQLTLIDRCLGRVIAAAEAAGWTVLVTGLRGLALGLHGHVGQGGAAPFGELVHVPAIIADPAGGMAGQRFGGLVVPADLGATLAEIVGGAVPKAGDAPWHGMSVAGLFAAWIAPRRDRVVAVARGGVAIATPAWHCVAERSRVRLFAKPDDYFELCDVADRCPDVVDELAAVAAATAAGDGSRAWRATLSEPAVSGTG